MIKGMLDKTPFKPIKSLFEINLYCHRALFAFGCCHGVDDFLGNNDIVTGFSSWHKPSLKGMNKVAKVSFQPAYQDFCYGFVKGVAKSNGANLMDYFWFKSLWDKAKKSGV